MGSIRTTLTAAVLGAATIAGVLLPAAAAQAAPAEAPNAVSKAGKSDLADAGFVIASQINKIVSEAHAQSSNRAGYVKSLQEGVWWSINRRLNVLVIKARHPYDAQFSGVAFDRVVSADGFPAFRVVAFQSGTVTNKGDGGYINWAYAGSFNRSGNKVTFYRF